MAELIDPVAIERQTIEDIANAIRERTEQSSPYLDPVATVQYMEIMRADIDFLFCIGGLIDDSI